MEKQQSKSNLMLRLIITCISLIFIAEINLAQDLNFSQLFHSPLSLNPANTGHHEHNWRFINNYRSQWRSLENPYTTIAVSYDHQYFIFAQRFSWSVYYVNDVSGDQSLKSNKFYLSGAYHYHLRNHIVHAGFQAGVVTRSFTTTNLTFPDQFNMSTGFFDPGLPTDEIPLNDRLFYPDVNAGIIISRKAKRFEPEIGAAIYHLNFPKENFIYGDNRLQNRNVYHAGAKIFLTPKAYLEPLFVFLQHSKSNAYMGGMNADIPLPDNSVNLNYFYAGAFVRAGLEQEADAMIFNTGLKFKSLVIGISYDYNISQLQTATSSRGAFEFSLLYFGPTTSLSKITIPCERY